MLLSSKSRLRKPHTHTSAGVAVADDAVVVLGVVSSTPSGDDAFRAAAHTYMTCGVATGAARNHVLLTAITQLTLWSYAFAWLLALALTGIVLLASAAAFRQLDDGNVCIAIFFFVPQFASAIIAVSSVHVRTFELSSNNKRPADTRIAVTADPYAPVVGVEGVVDTTTTWPSWTARLVCYCACALATLLFLVLVPALGWLKKLRERDGGVFVSLLALAGAVLFLYAFMIVAYAVAAYAYARRKMRDTFAH